MSVFHGYTYHLWCFQFSQLQLVLLYLHELKKVKKIKLCSVENNFQQMIHYHKAVTFLSWPLCLIYEHPSDSQHKHCN